MRKIIVLGLMLASYISMFSQRAADLFVKPDDIKISWLGIDFSHVKLIGNFAEFSELGDKSAYTIRSRYFPGWNELILNEAKKYDIKGMLRLNDIFIDIDMIMDKNSKTPVESLESYNANKFTPEDIKKFVDEYDLKDKKGIGIVFIAENLNKSMVIADIYFVAINMATKEILIVERFSEEPIGIGVRNYWAGAVYRMIKEIDSNAYNRWRKQYK